MGEGVLYKSYMFKQNWIIWIQSTSFKFLVFWPDHTHQPTQPPTHSPNYTPTHGWGILQRFQIFKRNWNILISSSVIKFLLILGIHPPGGCRWVDGGGFFMGVWRVSHAHTQTHTHACTCTHACMHMHVEHDKHAKHGCLHVGGHLQFYTCVCMHVHACACMWGYPHAPRCPQTPPHLPPPQSCREPKTPKFYKSWTNLDISILFEDSLPLNTSELIQTIVVHPGYPPPTCPTHPEPRKPKSEELQ